MKKGILIKTLALAAAAVLATSCAYILLDDKKPDAVSKGEYNIVISGLVSDIASNTAIQDIQIIFEAFASNDISILPVESKTVKSDSRGIYLIEAKGFSEPITCRLCAESPQGAEVKYRSEVNEIVVTWKEESFDKETNTLYVNDHNFQLTKE